MSSDPGEEMTRKRYLKAYLGALVAFLVLDGLWIGLVVRSVYENEAGAIMLESPNPVAAGFFYVFYAVAIVVLAVRPAFREASLDRSLINGAVLGATAYGTYSVTNYAILKGWTVTLVVTDVPWAAFLTAACAAAGYLAARVRR